MIETFIAEDCESAILGKMLADSRCIDEALSLVHRDDFAPGQNRVFFDAISYTHSHGGCDAFTVSETLKSTHDTNDTRADRLAELFDLEQLGRMTLKIAPHARTLIKNRRMRDLLKGCEEVRSLAEGGSSVDECIARVHEAMDAAESDSGEKQARHIKDVLADVISEMGKQARQKGMFGLTTGIKGLDVATTGIRAGELWVVGALPSRGKTAFGVQLAGANVEQGVETCIFSLEMSDRQIARRLLTNCSGAGASKIRDPHFLLPNDWKNIRNAAEGLIAKPLWVDDVSGMSSARLAQKARLYKRKHGIKLLVVDYLMLLDEPAEKERRNKAGKIANALRQLAKDEDMAVVLLSQLSRPRDKDINARPSMLDLKESGDIEAAAHVVLLLYMPMGADGQPTGDDEIIIGKQREGCLGSVPVSYSRDSLMFRDRAY